MPLGTIKLSLCFASPGRVSSKTTGSRKFIKQFSGSIPCDAKHKINNLILSYIEFRSPSYFSFRL